jgi:branched-chain amino acid transport system ATP-binding protein
MRSFLGDGTTIFLIDHDMGLVLNVCDYIYVLDFGRIIAEGTPAQIRKDPAVVQAYLGQSAGEMQAKAGEALAARVSSETQEGSDHG